MSPPKVHHISAATMCPFGRRFVEGRGAVFEPAYMVAHCLLVELPAGLLLVDTGLGRADIADPGKRLGTLFTLSMGLKRDFYGTAFARIRALGYKPEDVRDIVVTHLDLDHAGGLPDFPDARVHVYDTELRAMEDRLTTNERLRYRTPHFAHGPKWVRHEVTGDLWFGFEAVRALPGTDGDVFLVPLIGHTRGHAGVAVRTGSGWLLHAGDAYFSHFEMQDPPSCPPALALFQRRIALDDHERRANQVRLRELVRDRASEVTVFSAHCPVEFEKLAAASAAEREAAPAAPITSGSTTA